MPETVSFTSADRDRIVVVAAALIDERVPFQLLPHVPSYVEHDGEIRELGGGGGWTVQVAGDDGPDLNRVAAETRTPPSGK